MQAQTYFQPFTFFPGIVCLIAIPGAAVLGIGLIALGGILLFASSRIRAFNQVEVRWDDFGFRFTASNGYLDIRWEDIEEIEENWRSIRIKSKDPQPVRWLDHRWRRIRYRKDFVPFYREVARRYPKEMAHFRFP